MDDLKPCPWCGAEAKFVRHHYQSNLWMVGTGCDCDIMSGFPRKCEVAKWWNNRHADTQLAEARAECERLKVERKFAAGECLVEVPEVGSVAGKLLVANRLMRREIANLRAECERLTNTLGEIAEKYDAAKDNAAALQAVAEAAERWEATRDPNLSLDAYDDAVDDLTAQVRAFQEVKKHERPAPQTASERTAAEKLEYTLRHLFHDSPEHRNTVLQAAVDLISDYGAAERERCAKAVCHWCDAGEVAERKHHGNLYDWLHPHGKGEWGICNSAAIHELGKETK